MFKALEEKLASSQASMSAEIAGLRESRSEVSGKDYAAKSQTSQGNWLVGIIITGIFGLLGFAVGVISLVRK